MTHTEAADLILWAAKSTVSSHASHYPTILSAVATVMDAARADALEPSIAFIAAYTGALKDGTIIVCSSPSMDEWRAFDAAIRALAQSHRETTP